MKKGQGDNAANGSIVIKRVKKIEGGHHGGAWKVAYADFVTAMMAFFLMLWLLSTTTKEQKEGISDYFTMALVSAATGGSDGMLGGQSLNKEKSVADGTPTITLSLAPPNPPTNQPDDEQNAANPPAATVATLSSSSAEAASPMGMEANNANPSSAQASSSPQTEKKTIEKVSEEALNQAIADREKKIFENAEREIKQAIRDIPELAQLSGQLIIDHTPAGMRIQLVDDVNRPMFKEGTAEPYVRTRAMFGEIAKVVNRLPNRIAISGHTDAAAFQRPDGYGNWELSADRAMLGRRLLREAGVADARFSQISGKAGTEPLFPEDPYIAGNRRVSITMLREAPVLTPGALISD